MNNLKQQITDHCRQFKTTGISNIFDILILEAEASETGFMEYTLRLLQAEAEHRHHNEVQRRLKTARLPHNSSLDHYDHSFENGIQKTA